MTLAISFIEASAALLVHHPSKRWHAFRLGLNSIVQLDLLCADLWSYWRHVSSDTWTWPSLLLTQGLLAAAATHIYYGQGIVRAISRRGRQERELAGLGALVMLGWGCGSCLGKLFCSCLFVFVVKRALATASAGGAGP